MRRLSIERVAHALACLFLCVLVCNHWEIKADIELNDATVGDGPYYMDQADSTYILIENIDATGSALVFAAQNVTLDLGGYTATWGTAGDSCRFGVALPPSFQPGSGDWSVSDITTWNVNHGATVTNGSIIQSGAGIKNAAIRSYESNNSTVTGVTILVYGDDTRAIFLSSGNGATVSGCTLTDSTSVISNRHAGRAAIGLHNTRAGVVEVHGNTMHNCPQWGIRVSRITALVDTWGHIYDNNIYLNNIVTNGYSIGLHGDKLEAYSNTIDAANGRGIHVELCDSVKVYDNNISVTNEPHWAEYGSMMAHGLKFETCTNTEAWADTVVSYGAAAVSSQISKGCALSVQAQASSNNYIHDCIFKAYHTGGAVYDSSAHWSTALEIIGTAEASGLRIEDNEFVTHDRFLYMTNEYYGSYPDSVVNLSGITLLNNTWTREAAPVGIEGYDISFYKCLLESLRIVNSTGDADWQNGFVDYEWKTSKWSEAWAGSVLVTLEAVPSSGKTVAITDSSGAVADSVTTGATGKAYVILDEWMISLTGNPNVADTTYYNPHTFTAVYEGDSSTVATCDSINWAVTLEAGDGAMPTWQGGIVE